MGLGLGGHIYAQDTVRVTLEGDALTDTSTTPTDAEVGYQIASTGLERSYFGTGQPYVTLDTWLLSGSAGDYDCYMEDLGTGTDTPAGSAVDTWLGCGTTRAWTLTDTSVAGSAKTFNGTIKIRDASTLDELVTASVTMSVEEQV